MHEFVAVFPDGTEQFVTRKEHPVGRLEWADLAREAMRLAGRTRPWDSRADDHECLVRLHAQRVKNGEVIRLHPVEVHVSPGRETFTLDEYQAAKERLLGRLPEVIRSPAAVHASEAASRTGSPEEVLVQLENFVKRFEGPLAALAGRSDRVAVAMDPETLSLIC